MNAPAAIPIDRRAERVHLFLVATLYFGGASVPVRVRNLSASGALVEGASLPPVGTTVILRRGALETSGTAVWSDAGKAGLAFGGLVDVSAWLPVKAATRQTQVDQIAFGVKHAPPPAAVAAPASDKAHPFEAALSELIEVQLQIRSLGDQLSLDASVLANHPQVQYLDAADQRIGKILDTLRAAVPR